jgi:hypothetical protein
MLRIVLLLDSFQVPAWVFESIQGLFKEKGARIVLAVINETPRPSGEKSPMLYRVYRKIDRTLFLQDPDAFALKNLKSLPQWDIPEISVKPIQKKFTDYFQVEDLKKISSFSPDLIIRFGFRILKGDILKIAPMGVWSFHHGDNLVNRGGPPCFWEVMNKEETTGLVLQKLSEKLDDGQVLYRSWSQTAPFSVQRNANKVFWKSSQILARIVRQIQLLGVESWEQQVQNNQLKETQKLPILKPPKTWLMLKLWTNLWIRNVSWKLNRLVRKPFWEILIQSKSLGNQGISRIAPDSEIIRLKNPLLRNGDFWADPFPIEEDGRIWVFIEWFEKGKGKIAVGEWNGENLSNPKVIIEETWHLSYPFVWREEEEHFLIPESGEAGKVFIYHAINFPFQWEKKEVLFNGELYDPTLLKIGDTYWLFGNRKPHPGASSFDELYLYYSNSLEAGSWISHPMNPIVSDVRCSRPAGRIIKKDGKLFRPAQDSGKRYGHRIKIQEILVLNKKEYLEQTVDQIDPDFLEGILGTHTLNYSKEWIFTDAFSLK